MTETEPTQRDRRPLWTVMALLALGAAALWVASLLTWTWRVDLAGGVAVARPLRGAQAQPALVGLALAALAAVAVVLATGGWLRRAIGVLLVAGGAGALVVAVRGIFEPRTRHASEPGFERWLDDIAGWSAQSAVAIGLAALAGLALLAGGVIVLAAGHRMPRMGSRYQTPSARRAAPAPERALWDDLDAGRDPTT